MPYCISPSPCTAIQSTTTAHSRLTSFPRLHCQLFGAQAPLQVLCCKRSRIESQDSCFHRCQMLTAELPPLRLRFPNPRSPIRMASTTGIAHGFDECRTQCKNSNACTEASAVFRTNEDRRCCGISKKAMALWIPAASTTPRTPTTHGRTSILHSVLP